MKPLLILAIIATIITLQLRQTKINEDYWDNITKQCADVGGFMSNNGCEIN